MKEELLRVKETEGIRGAKEEDEEEDEEEEEEDEEVGRVDATVMLSAPPHPF